MGANRFGRDVCTDNFLERVQSGCGGEPSAGASTFKQIMFFCFPRFILLAQPSADFRQVDLKTVCFLLRVHFVRRTLCESASHNLFVVLLDSPSRERKERDKEREREGEKKHAPN